MTKISLDVSAHYTTSNVKCASKNSSKCCWYFFSILFLGAKEEDDDEEITEITGGNDDPENLYGRRHITPKFLESGQTSRTLSSSSQNDPKVALSPTITVTAPTEKDHVIKGFFFRL